MSCKLVHAPPPSPTTWHILSPLPPQVSSHLNLSLLESQWWQLWGWIGSVRLEAYMTGLALFAYWMAHAREACDGRSNYSPVFSKITLSLSIIGWHSLEGTLLPTARPWLCLSGASGRGKAESSWLAQTVWGLALQPRLPRHCWVGLGWQPLRCYFSEVVSEINRRTLSRGKGGLGWVVWEFRSQCWVCELEWKLGPHSRAAQGTSWLVRMWPLHSVSSGHFCRTVSWGPLW